MRSERRREREKEAKSESTNLDRLDRLAHSHSQPSPGYCCRVDPQNQTQQRPPLQMLDRDPLPDIHLHPHPQQLWQCLAWAAHTRHRLLTSVPHHLVCPGRQTHFDRPLVHQQPFRQVRTRPRQGPTEPDVSYGSVQIRLSVQRHGQPKWTHGLVAGQRWMCERLTLEREHEQHPQLQPA